MSTELEVLKSICQALQQANIPYMLTGSFAANFYAVPRMTRDIDIVIEIFKNETDKLFEIFKNDFYIDQDSIDEAIKHESMFNIIHNESVFKIDFIIRKDSAYRNLEFQRRRSVKLNDVEIWIVSPEDLIISKLFWAKESFSETQINDVKNLLKSLKNLDFEYLQKWINSLKLNSIYEKVRFHA